MSLQCVSHLRRYTDPVMTMMTMTIMAVTVIQLTMVTTIMMIDGHLWFSCSAYIEEHADSKRSQFDGLRYLSQLVKNQGLQTNGRILQICLTQCLV